MDQERKGAHRELQCPEIQNKHCPSQQWLVYLQPSIEDVIAKHRMDSQKEI